MRISTIWTFGLQRKTRLPQFGSKLQFSSGPTASKRRPGQLGRLTVASDADCHCRWQILNLTWSLFLTLMTKPLDTNLANRAADEKSASGEASAEINPKPEDAAQFKRRTIKKAVVLLGTLLALGILTSLPPVRHFVSDQQPHLKQFVHDFGPWAPVVFIVSVAGLVGCGFPRLALHFLGGALFAFWGGLLWSCIGTMIGYCVVFFAVRQLGLQKVILRKHPAWQKLAAKLKHNTIPAVIIFRQLPLPGMVTNVVLGLSPIRRREFFLGSSIGLFPEAVPMVLIGSGLRKEELGHTVLYLIGAVVLFIAIWIAWGTYIRRATTKEAALDKI
jgi:uncharacterized membrane protein YdjX (TVP38/TMEM64 family)